MGLLDSESQKVSYEIAKFKGIQYDYEHKAAIIVLSDFENILIPLDEEQYDSFLFSLEKAISRHESVKIDGTVIFQRWGFYKNSSPYEIVEKLRETESYHIYTI